MGTTKPFKRVELSKPPRMTCAIGLWISLPGRSLPTANGIKASADVSAVIRMGFKRSSEPCMILSTKSFPSSRNWL